MSRGLLVRRGAALFALAGAGAGCAVMTIDVDVYKGPLANHEDVQVEQMAAMAIGAKPLLIRLRNALEWPEEPSPSWAWDGFVPPRPSGASPFACASARRVNAILSLYEGQVDSTLSLYFELGKRWIGEGLAARNELRPDPVADEALWSSLDGMSGDRWMYGDRWKQVESRHSVLAPVRDRIRTLDTLVRNIDATSRRAKRALAWLARLGADFPALSRAVLRLQQTRARLEGQRGAMRRAARAVAQAAVRLRSGYRQFLRPGAGRRRSIRGLQSADLAFAEGLEKLRALGLGAPVLGAFPQSATAGFQLLARGRVTRAHGRLLGLAGEELDAFVARTKGLAASWLTARDRAAKTLVGALDFTVTVNESDKPRIRAARGQLNTAVFKLIASIVKANALHAALVNRTAQRDAPTLRGRLGVFGPAFFDERRWADDLVKRGRFKSWYQDLFLRHPVRIARESRAAHVAFIAGFDELPPPVYDNYYDSDARRAFGVTLARPEDIRYEELRARLEEVARLVSGAGLDRGRVASGIEDATDEYLNLRHALGPEPTAEERAAVQRAGERLSDLLINFAEKVLFIANNDALLNPPHEWGLLGDIGNLVEGVFSSEGSRPTDYVRVLQAVGSSILIQVDELRHRDAHGRRIERATGQKVAALRRALAKTPGDLLGDLLADLREQASGAAKKAAAALAVQTERAAAVAKRTTEQGRADAAVATKKAEVAAAKRAARPKHEKVEAIEEVIAVLAEKDVKPAVLDKIKDGGNLDGAALIDEIRAVLKKPDGLFVVAPAQARRDRVSSFLETHKASAKAVIKTSPPDDACAGLEKWLADNLEVARANDEQAAAGLRKLEAALTGLEAAAKVAAAALAAATKSKATADAEVASTKAASEQLAAARAAVDDFDAQAAAKVRSDATPSATYEALLGLIRDDYDKKKSAAGDDAGKKKAAAARKLGLDWLAERPAPVDPLDAADLALGANPDARDVLDSLTSILEFERILAVRAGRKARAKDIGAALAAAAEHRSGLVYIRPAAAYVRSSYPASALQHDPGLGERNMLWEHALHSVPGYNWVKRTNRDLVVQSEIDKQFWQNINHVRVAGGGNTNYVVAKDDIGNWYVKSYASDPKPIIRSATNLARFSLGGSLGAELPIATTDPTDPTKTVQNQPATRETTTVGKLLAKYREDYETRTEADRDELAKLLEGGTLQSRIRAVWKASEVPDEVVEQASPKLDAAAKAHLDEALELLKAKDSKQSKGARIVTALQAVRRFHNNAAAEIGKLAFDGDEEKGRDSAQRGVTTVVRATLNDFGRRRKEAVGDYETAILFIGDATK